MGVHQSKLTKWISKLIMATYIKMPEEAIITKQILVPGGMSRDIFRKKVGKGTFHKATHSLKFETPGKILEQKQSLAADSQMDPSEISQHSMSFAPSKPRLFTNPPEKDVSERIELARPFSFAQTSVDSPKRYTQSPSHTKDSLSKKASILTPSFGSAKHLELRSVVRRSTLQEQLRAFENGNIKSANNKRSAWQQIMDSKKSSTQTITEGQLAQAEIPSLKFIQQASKQLHDSLMSTHEVCEQSKIVPSNLPGRISKIAQYGSRRLVLKKSSVAELGNTSHHIQRSQKNICAIKIVPEESESRNTHEISAKQQWVNIEPLSDNETEKIPNEGHLQPFPCFSTKESPRKIDALKGVRTYMLPFKRVRSQSLKKCRGDVDDDAPKLESVMDTTYGNLAPPVTSRNNLGHESTMSDGLFFVRNPGMAFGDFSKEGILPHSSAAAESFDQHSNLLQERLSRSRPKKESSIRRVTLIDQNHHSRLMNTPMDRPSQIQKSNISVGPPPSFCVSKLSLAGVLKNKPHKAQLKTEPQGSNPILMPNSPNLLATETESGRFMSPCLDSNVDLETMLKKCKPFVKYAMACGGGVSPKLEPPIC